MNCRAQTIIAQYCLDGNANDASGNGYDGNAVNVTPATDRFGNVNGAMRFDSTSYIALPPVFPINGSYRSVCVWIKPDLDGTFNAAPGCVISSGTWPISAPYFTAFNIYSNYTGQNNISFRSGSTHPFPEIIANPGINDTHWHFICITMGSDTTSTCRDGSGNPLPTYGLNFYIDGIFKGVSVGCGYNTIGQSNFIGQSNDPNSRDHFLGLIDDVSIWNGALSDTSVLSLYNSTTSCKSLNVEESNNNLINLYPNPLTFSSILQLNAQVKDAEVFIYDMLGKEMMKKKLTGNKMEIEKGSLENGVYFVRISDNEREYVQKMVVE